MDITSIDNIKNQYMSVLASDTKYTEILTELKLKDKSEPISNFKALNPEEPPDYENEERELQEILLDLTAINNGIIEIKNYVDSLISNVDAAISNTESILEQEENRLQDINMICGKASDYNMVIPVTSSYFEEGSKFEQVDDNTIGAYAESTDEIDYEIASISGNGISGNIFIYNNDTFENEENDYSDTSYITDDSDITAYEYERLITTDRQEVKDGVINFDNKPAECVITLAAEEDVCKMRLLSETKDLTIKQIEISDDGISWKKQITDEIRINDTEALYNDNSYIYGSNLILFPYTSHLRLTLSSDECLDDIIAYEDESLGEIVKCPNTKRKKIRINNIKLYSSVYVDSDITSEDLLSSGSVDKIALFVSEYIPDHFADTYSISYYLEVNGTEYEVQPVNSGREGTRLIKYSEVVDALSTQSYVKLIDETIKSAKVRIVINSYNGNETPYVSNIKLCLGKDTGSIYV